MFIGDSLSVSCFRKLTPKVLSGMNKHANLVLAYVDDLCFQTLLLLLCDPIYPYG